MNTVKQDVQSLNDYEAHLSSKVQFLLDATLGFINIEQNNFIKVLTVVSVVGIPPVLIAGIYGMNFKNIPEYDWSWGYQYSPRPDGGDGADPARMVQDPRLAVAP